MSCADTKEYKCPPKNICCPFLLVPKERVQQCIGSWGNGCAQTARAFVIVCLLLRIGIHKIELSINPLQIRVIKAKWFTKLYSLNNDTLSHRESADELYFGHIVYFDKQGL